MKIGSSKTMVDRKARCIVIVFFAGFKAAERYKPNLMLKVRLLNFHEISTNSFGCGELWDKLINALENKDED